MKRPDPHRKSAAHVPGGRRSGSRALAAALCLLVATAASLAAHPFEPDYVPTLGSLRWDGDLALFVPLASVRVSDELDLQVSLKHELVPLGYGDLQSRFACVPLQSALTWSPDGRFVWRRPGGGERVFSRRDQQPDSGAMKGPLEQQWDAVFARDNLRLFVEAEGRRALILDEGWALMYEAGGLVRIQSPQGMLLGLTHEGPYVTRIHKNGETLLEFEMAAGRPFLLRLQGRPICRFVESPAGRLDRVVTLSGQDLANFSYDEMGRLNASKVGSGAWIHYAWREIPEFARGDSPYVKPAFITAVDRARYEYSIRHELITMRQTGPDGDVETLRAQTKLGRLVWLSGDR